MMCASALAVIELFQLWVTRVKSEPEGLRLKSRGGSALGEWSGLLGLLHLLPTSELRWA